MATIITLSSSPPPVFARSPTPVRYSSSPRKATSPGHLGQTTSHAQFEHAQTFRDGFGSGFTTARRVLGTISSAENVPVEPKKLNPLKSDHATAACSKKPSVAPSVVRSEAAHNDDGGTTWYEPADATVLKILPSDLRRNKKVKDVKPLHLERAIARRKDWTPEKPDTLQNMSSDTSAFGIDLAQSFGHASHDTTFGKPSPAEDRPSIKRRKTEPSHRPEQNVVNNKSSLTKGGKAVVKQRNRSPAKKALTITGLTTSHFVEDDMRRDNATVMMQFLASTQARAQSGGGKDSFDTEIVKKLIKSRKSNTRSRLKSPGTSIEALGQQDFIFASASQLARDESPTLLKDTIEATKQSEEDLFSDPIPTQQTAPVSIESTSPKTGLSRFRSRKALWTAAHRDEDNALLHHHDPFDNTQVRSALKGKDALVENDGDGTLRVPGESVDDSLALLATLHEETAITYDIDDITTPQLPKRPLLASNPVQSFSSSTKSSSSKRTKDACPPCVQVATQETEPIPSKSTIPPKPNYTIWPDDDLKKQVDEHGFRRLRARKTMIEKLDELWAQRYGLDPLVVKAATKAASKTTVDRDHGHFLSKVHELSSRSVPKMKRSRTKRTTSEPLSRCETKSKINAKSEDAIMLDDSIIDIDDIDNTTVYDRLAGIKPFADEPIMNLEPSTAPTKGTGVKAASKRKRKAKFPARPLTPPPSMPAKTIPDSSPGFESPQRARPDVVSLSPVSEANDADYSLKSHIRAALQHTPENTQHRNHQKDPTWYEKMLLYDPIILEEFTAWLNTEGFNSIGVDDEIDAKEVKTWCEENGICCLWKGGWRGNKVKE